MPPKLPLADAVPEVSEAMKPIHDLFTAAWTPSTDEAGGKASSNALSVLGDHFQEKAGTQGDGTKIFAKDSIEVKKDLYKNVMGMKKTDTSYASVAGDNLTKRIDRRHDTAYTDEGDFKELGDPTNKSMVTSVMEPKGTQLRSSIATNRTYKKTVAGSVVTGPQAPDGSEDGVWKNLMEDPAYPSIAALLAGGGVAAAALAGRKAEAAPKKVLNLKPAQAPQVDWEGVTQHILDAEDQDNKLQMTRQYSGLNRDPAHSDQMLGEEVNNFLSNHKITDYTLPMAPATALSALEEHIISPATKWAQKNVGTPLLDMYLATPQGQAVKSLPGGEYMARAAGAFSAGPDQLDAFGSSGAGRKDIGNLTDKVGELPAAAAATAAKTAGEAPLFLIRGPKMLKVLPKVLETGVVGAEFGLADPNMSWKEGAVGGAILHTGTTMLGDLLSGISSAYSKELPALESSVKSIFKKGNPFGNRTDAEVLAKNPKMAAENQLVGVIDGAGLDAVTADLAKAPAEPRVTKLLPGGKDSGTRQWAVATLDESGQPVLKTQIWDPVNKQGRVETESLTVKSALAASKGIPMRSLDNSMIEAEALGNHREEIGAFLGYFGKGFAGLAEKKVAKFDPIMLDSAPDMAERDYQGTIQQPAGAETRIERGMPTITPVFKGETRLPDEIDPSEALTQIWGYGKKETDMMQGLFKRKEAAMAEKYPSDIRPTKSDLSRTEPGTVSDAMKIGVKPMWGGGSGGKPPEFPSGQKLLGGGSEIRVRGPLAIEKPVVPPPNDVNVSWDQREGLDYILKNLKQIQTEKSGIDKVLSLTVGNHMRGPVDQATLVQSIQATTLLQRSSDDILKAARKEFTPHLLDQLDRHLNDFFLGKKSWADIEAANGPLTQKAKQFGNNLMAEKEALDSYLASKGVVPEDLMTQRLNGTLDLYLSRRYMAFAMPNGRWAKKLLTTGLSDTLSEGVRFILNEARKKDPNVTGDEVLAEVMKTIRAKDPLQSFKDSMLSKPFSSLLARGQVPPPIQKLLGVIDSGMINIATTLGNQRAIAARVDLMEEISKNPKWASDSMNPDMGHVYQLPDHPSMHTMRNKFTNEALYEAIGNAPKMEAASHALAHNILGFIKGNQVALGGLGPHLNSFFGNLYSGVLAGGLDLTRPHKIYPSFRKAFLAMRDYADDPTGQTGLGGIVLDAKRSGADYFGFGHEEIGNPNARRFLRDLEEVFPDDKAQGFFEAFGKVISKSMVRYRDLQSHAGSPLDVVDRLFRMQSFIFNQEKFLADLAKNGDNSQLVKQGMLPPGGAVSVGIHDKNGKLVGLTEYQKNAHEIRAMQNALVKSKDNGPIQRQVLEAAARLSSRRVNQSFWNPTFIGSGLDALRRSGVGIITPYATAAFESFRINTQVFPRMIQEPELKWRMLTAAIVTAGAVGITQQFGSVSREECEAAYAEIPKGKNVFKPATFCLMWHDSKGRVQLFDTTRLFDPFRFGVGHPDDAMWRRVLVNLVETPTEGTEAGSFTRDAFVAGGFVRPTDVSQPPAMSQQGAMRVLQHLQKAGAFPGIIKPAADAAVRTGLVPGIKPTQEPLTPLQGAIRATGISNIEPVTAGPGPSRTAREIEFRSEKGALKKDQKRIFRGSGTTTEKVEAVKPIQEERKRIFKDNADRASKRKK